MTFKHLTFNTMGAPFKIKTKWRFEQMGKIFVALATNQNVDVMTIQEAYGNRLREKMIIAPWLQISEWFSAPKDKGKRFGTSGLITLSQQKIVETKFKGFSRGSGQDSFVNKGILLTRLDLGAGQQIDVYNTHTQASYISQRIRCRTRLKQVDEILSFIQETHDPKHPVMLTGDLNMDEYNEEYHRLVNIQGEIKADEFKFIDIMRQLFPDRQLYPLKTLRRKNPLSERKLDHVLLRPGSQWQWIKEQSSTQVLDFNLSDHKAVLSQLQFTRNP